MAAGLPVVLYTQPGCSLCTQLQEDLAWLEREVGPLVLEEQDIRHDPAVYDQFRYLIPVLEVGGVVHYPPHDLLHVRRTLLDARRQLEAQDTP
jgi:hypothetical protein